MLCVVCVCVWEGVWVCIGGGEGERCSAFEAVIETRVVGRREGDHELSRELHRLCKDNVRVF